MRAAVISLGMPNAAVNPERAFSRAIGLNGLLCFFWLEAWHFTFETRREPIARCPKKLVVVLAEESCCRDIYLCGDLLKGKILRGMAKRQIISVVEAIEVFAEDQG